MSGTFMAVDPSTGHEIAELPETSAEQVAALVEHAHRALAVEHDWRTPYVRAQALYRLASGVEADAGTLADLETRDTGMPLSQARDDVAAAVRCLDYYAGSIERLEGRQVPLGPGLLDYTVREPWGVCAQLIAWSRPLETAARCAAPALAAGNAVILKPSELASLTPLRLAELAERAGVPRGFLQAATGGEPAGAALVDHPGVAHVTFVGSPAAGARVAQACARRLAGVELELADAAPSLVFADADFDAAVPAIVRGGMEGARLHVERARYDELAERVSRALRAVTVGPGIEDPDLGPLISERHAERVAAMVRAAVAEGAALVAGGEPSGRFAAPTLLADVRPDTEIFGPVLCLAPFDDEHEAVALANAAPHRAAAGVWTRDLARAHRVAAAIRARQVFVNGAGGGSGRGVDALLAYSQVKRVCVAI